MPSPALWPNGGRENRVGERKSVAAAIAVKIVPEETALLRKLQPASMTWRQVVELLCNHAVAIDKVNQAIANSREKLMFYNLRAFVPAAWCLDKVAKDFDMWLSFTRKYRSLNALGTDT
jgi:hypothetical protein